MKQYNAKDFTTETVDIDVEKRKVKAVWARFGNVDLDNDIIIPEAVTKTLKERGPKGKNLIWSLVDHCTSIKNALGKPLELYVEGDKLIAVTPIVDTEIGEDTLKLYEAGLINQHSIGFSTIKSEWDKDGQVRTIKELMLYEGSAVLWGANPLTPTLDIMKGLSIEERKENLNGRLEKLLKSFKFGNFTDETFSLLEIEIKQIQTAITELSTQPATEVAVVPDESKVMFDALTALNNSLKSFEHDTRTSSGRG